MQADNDNKFDHPRINSAFHDDRVMDSMLNKMFQSETDQQEFLHGCMERISAIDNDEELRILGDSSDMPDSSYDLKQAQAEAVQLMGIAAVLLVGCFMYSMFLSLKSPERVYARHRAAVASDDVNQDLLVSQFPRQVDLVDLNEMSENAWDEFVTSESENVGEPDLEQAIVEAKTGGDIQNRLKTDDEKISEDVVKQLLVEDTTPKRHLNIRLKFSRTDRINLLLNDELVSRNLKAFEARTVLLSFVPELNQRSSFLGPRLGKVFGAISIDKGSNCEEFAFESSAQVMVAIQNASATLTRISPSVESATAKSRTAFSSLVQATNDLFQGWAQDAIESGVCETPMYRADDEKYARIIDRSKFGWFAMTGNFDVQPDQLYLAETTIQHLDSDALRMRLAQNTQELSLFNGAAEFNSFKNTYGLLPNTDDFDSFRDQPQPIHQLVQGRQDLDGLPLVMGNDCHLEKGRANSLDLVSRELGPTMSMSLQARSEKHINQISRRQLHVVANLLPDYTGDSQKLLTVDQMVQHEVPKLKHDFIAKLGRERSQVNANLLACYAKFDLDAGVRMAATRALASYQPEMYRKRLLDGFLYPWDVVAQHSAEAIVRLHDVGSVSALVELLRSPNPTEPYRNGKGELVQRELVAVNHMKNCVLCHGVSYSTSDRGRATVPEWTQPISRGYYNPTPVERGLVARADITYLRQDFSVVQPVADHGHWPANQRFDYLVREAPYSHAQATGHAVKNGPSFRESILFALRMLTDETPAVDSYVNWKEIAEGLDSTGP